MIGSLLTGIGLGVGLEGRAMPKRQAEMPVSDVVRARQFQVVDRDGTVRMRLGMDDDGAARLSLLAKSNKPAVVVQVDSHGDAAISLRDRGAQERASVAVSEEKGTVLALSGNDSQPIAALGVLPDGSEALSMLRVQRDAAGKGVRLGTAVIVTPEGKTELRYYTKNGKTRVVTP
jgi:hypothetical protein